MANKKKIGLSLFFNNQTNSGIVNYIYNIVAALNSLPEHEKPTLVILYYQTSPIDFIKSIGYKKAEYLLFKPSPVFLPVRAANAFIKKIFKIDVYKNIKYFNRFDVFYPYFEFSDFELKTVKNKIHWLVDFNNCAFPNHYHEPGKTDLINFQKRVTKSTETIILSSNTLLDELKHYYPGHTCDIRVMRFACSLPKLDINTLPDILEKHKLKQTYFMSPNQFWEHKNQVVVIEAMHILKQKHPLISFRILFTGSLQVSRGNGFYADILREKIDAYQLSDNILFLGVLERSEQLLLMKNALALIQPSLYEGWSTLVEEAKALNQLIILSDLPVHKEQIQQNVIFFNPHDANALAEIMYQQYLQPKTLLPIDYKKDIQAFGQQIVKCLLA